VASDRLQVVAADAGVPDALDHLAVVALELRPGLVAGLDPIDGLEGPQQARIRIEGLVEELHRVLVVLELVPVDDAGRVAVAGDLVWTILELDRAQQDLHRVRPLLLLRVEV